MSTAPFLLGPTDGWVILAEPYFWVNVSHHQMAGTWVSGPVDPKDLRRYLTEPQAKTAVSRMTPPPNGVSPRIVPFAHLLQEGSPCPSP